jgi:hypothetical protein
MNWIKANRNEMLLLLGSTVVTLALAAVFLQFSYYRGILPGRLYPQHYYTKDAQMGYDIVPNFKKQEAVLLGLSYDVWSNELGCFDMPYEKEQPYIYLTGDSFTWGYAPFEDKWGTLVQTLLGTRVLKCGVAGAGTRYELLRTARQLQTLPDPTVIVVGYDGNDVEDDALFPANSVHDGYLVDNYEKKHLSAVETEQAYRNLETYCIDGTVPKNPRMQALKCWLHNNSILYMLAAAHKDLFRELIPGLSVEKTAPASSPVRSESSYEENFKSILGFKDLAAQKGAKLLFVLIPSKKDEVRGSGPGVNDRVMMFLKENDIDYLDLRETFQKASKATVLHWPVDGHWNIAGNHLAGFAVSQFLLTHDIVKVSDKTSGLQSIATDMAKEFDISLGADGVTR